jgi:hypothetical protein
MQASESITSSNQPSWAEGLVEAQGIIPTRPLLQPVILGQYNLQISPLRVFFTPIILKVLKGEEHHFLRQRLQHLPQTLLIRYRRKSDPSIEILAADDTWCHHNSYR